MKINRKKLIQMELKRIKEMELKKNEMLFYFNTLTFKFNKN